MYGFMQMCNARQLDAYALNFLGKRISYGEMLAEIDCIARALYQAGVKKGEIVSICGLNTPEFFELIYAVNKVGAVSDLLGLTSSVSDLHDQISAAESHFVFVVDVACEKIIEACKGSGVEKDIRIPLACSLSKVTQLAIRLKGNGFSHFLSKTDEKVWDWRRFICAEEEQDYAPWEERNVLGSDLAIIVYTGGSTGIPKGVLLSNRAPNSYVVNYLQAQSM